MSQQYILISSINLNLFDINIYRFDNYSGEIINNETINEKMEELNTQELAIEVAQIVSEFAGVSRVDIFDKSNNLLLEVAPI